MSYQQARAWADQYNPHLNQIAASIMYQNNLMGVYFVAPTLHEDRKQGIDMHIITEPMKFSFRVRQASALPYFYSGFTIRTGTKGYPSELDKIQTTNFADYLLYSLAHPNDYGKIAAAVMIDCRTVGAYLKQDPSIIEKATKGKGFIEFEYNAFPEAIIVGTHGIDDKGEVICQ